MYILFCIFRSYNTDRRPTTRVIGATFAQVSRSALVPAIEFAAGHCCEVSDADLSLCIAS
jgi:hypothetical protein